MNKAVLVTKYGDIDSLHYTEIDIPTPRPHEVLIKVEATSVNFADIKGRLGIYHGTKSIPYVPGLDLVGTIEKVGHNVHSLKEGQRVIAFPSNGSYAEYTVADQELTFPISSELNVETAAAAPIVSFTSYQLLVDCAKISKGDTVLIHSASGGIGTTAIQLAKILGAKKIFGTVSSDERKSIVLEAGADFVYNYRNEDFSSEINQLTNYKGVDIVLDSLSDDIFGKSLSCLATFGRIVNFGNGKGSAGGKVNTLDLHGSCRSVIGYSMGTAIKHKKECMKQTADSIIPLLECGTLKMKISKSFPLKDVGLAQKLVEDRKNTGKILLFP